MCSALMTWSELDAGQGSSLSGWSPGGRVESSALREDEALSPAAAMEQVGTPRRQHNLVEGGDNTAQSESIGCTDKIAQAKSNEK